MKWVTFKRRLIVFLWSDGIIRMIRRETRLEKIRKVKQIYDQSDMD